MAGVGIKEKKEKKGKSNLHVCQCMGNIHNALSHYLEQHGDLPKEITLVANGSRDEAFLFRKLTK